ncbi:hypothetical protein H6G54_07855 [Anabaena cylindrica FACHB-243]|uniref:Uncharacterized protein n=1 Tax=Anabaena cylindrica (strain ATCC 27899 / PCC 7122) TaxID=272123 RepID=K9ZJP4_ANACC|nr:MULTISPECIES: hypothetical protein [Anabaena]AFZ59463.1 hypothetical protein Anacy_4095 [Anabaena cylindrica PCC 7122]MBD2417618.1 hypothetical protein [Anabaena cylindrica FACHB-243]MBY5283190.1 hypothetical protein [Anabaena sp. CCAP 1446/1C]MBY5308633.1 hypothetical protein [Anabaena sp. CCAP 1446/1C]MCM2405379.1 hypothetical protein [Anabaena sp. CCAP 1446/1C]
MSSIKISDLRPAGFDLFVDSESFLNESFLNDLSDSDLAITHGGSTPTTVLLIGAGWLGYNVGKELARFF